MSEREVILAEGFGFKRYPNSPGYVIGKVTIKVEEAIAFLKKHEHLGWVNIDIQVSKGGKPYCKLDTWRTDKEREEMAASGTPTKKSPVPKDTQKPMGATEPEEDLPF